MTEQLPPTGADWESEAETSAPLTWKGIGEALGRAWHRLGRATSDPRVTYGVLAFILLVAGAFRFTGLDWDEHQHLHPDERFLTMVENSLSWPKTLGEYFDTAKNPLNPYNHQQGTYVYGLFPVVMAKFIGQVVGKTGYDGVYLAGRGMSAAIDMLCVLLAFLIGRRLYGARAGLLGALLLALSVLDIQQAHYFTVDTSTTLFVTLALYLAVRVAQGEGWGSIVGMAAAFGMAVAAKISVLSFLLVIGLAYTLRLLARWKADEAAPAAGPLIDARGRLGRLALSVRVESTRPTSPTTPAERLVLHVFRAALSLGLVVLVAAVAFRIAQPQAFNGPGFFGLSLNEAWKKDMSYVAQLVSGKIDYPPSHQWTARAPVIYSLKNLVLWGLGVPLGLAVWASWALMAYEMLKKHKWAHLLPWVWMTFTFFYQSVQFVKTVRYMLPIYPTMAVIAGYGLIALWDWGKKLAAEHATDWRKWLRPASAAAVVAVVAGTALWALAFTGIYTRPVTRVAASRWIYQNLPPGSAITFELWDDPVPLNIDGHNASIEYNHIKMDNYWEDIPEKRDQLFAEIEQAQYIALTSNRLYGSIPRLPTRYPMTTRYYETLFSGELGFDKLIEFTSRPQLFGIAINDDNSDESFTVYDHPKVTIFVKRADFSMDNVRALLGGYDLERIVRVMPTQVTSAPNNLMLTPDEVVYQRAGGTWTELFDRVSLWNKLPTLTWLLALFLIGAAAFPLGFVAFRRLRDRGYILSKTLGLLLLTYFSWLLPSLKVLPYTRLTIALGLLVLLGAGAAVAWVQRQALGAFLRARWRLILANELLFLGFFLLFWLIRRGNPDLWHPVMGGEKPMDMAYLNAIIKSTYFPPYDPWFAGGYINYYYYGYVVVATITKLIAIVPWVAFNLAIPTFFALTAMGASCVAFNLIPAAEDEQQWLPRALRYGVVGALLVAVLGNLGELQLLLNGLQELGKGIVFESSIPGLLPLMRILSGLGALLFKGQQLPFRPEWWYWNASRIMTHGEINEFPFFTFLYADLHAHLTAMPFALLALGLATSFLVTPVKALSALARDLVSVPRRPAPPDEPAQPAANAAEGDLTVPVEQAVSGVEAEGSAPAAAPASALRTQLWAWWHKVDWALLWQLSLLALVVGELWCNNTWDYPTYLGISVVALALGLWEERKRIDQSSLTQLALRAGYLLILSVLFYYPYHKHFGSAYSSVEPWKGDRTPLGAYLIIHGTALFILISYLLALAFEKGTRNGVARTIRLYLRATGRFSRARHLYNLLVQNQSMGYELGWLGVFCVGALVLILLLAKAWLLLLAVPTLLLAVALTLALRAAPERRLQTMLIALGVLLTIAVEYIVLKGDIGRMNTVFKFYLQVWVLWGVVGAVALSYLGRRMLQWGSGARQAWRTMLGILLVSCALYPVLATYGKVRDRWNPDVPGGLDGMAYMIPAHYNDNNRDLALVNDYQAITWMQDHIVGSPVIAEANTPLYRWGGRVSIYTGLPSIIGWDWHQKQQRAAVSGQVVDWRLQDIAELYNTLDVARAEVILDRYQVGYIYVGELEAAYYDAGGLAKFDSMVGSSLQIAYRQGPVTIYRVTASGARELATGPTTPKVTRQGVGDWIARHWVPPVVRAIEPDLPTAVAPKPTVPPLMLDRSVDQLPVVGGRGWSPLAGSTVGEVLSWWVVLELVGLAAWGLVGRFLRRFRDGGYGLAKGIGLLLMSYLVWIGASLRLYANSPPAVWGALLLLGALSFFVWRRRARESGVRPFSRRLILVEEGLFSLAFLAFVGLRLLNPDLWQPWFGGEKMMEIAFLNALNRSAYMPPYDPYFAGGYLNYYYYGQFIATTLLKATGIAPEVGFNLAVPTFFALTVSHAFVLGYHLVSPEPGSSGEKSRRVASGIGAVVLTALAGNLTGALQLLEQLARAGGATFPDASVTRGDLAALFPGLLNVILGKASLPAFDYWYRATRVIPNTINEFPFFSFLFADLHPHMIGIPFTILALALFLALISEEGRDRLGAALRWGALAITVGALGVINTWDLPAYLGMLGCVMLYRGMRRGRLRAVVEAVISFLVLALGSVLLYAPFYAHYKAQDVGLALVPPLERTTWPYFAIIWGFFLFLVITLILQGLARAWPWARLHLVAQRRSWRRTLRLFWALGRRNMVLWVLGLGVLLGALGAGLRLLGEGMFVLALLVPFLAGAGVLLLAPRGDSAAFIQRLVLFVGLGILAGVEIVYIKDFLSGGEWRRMNTIFKFYIQAWVLLGLAAGSALPGLWRSLRWEGWAWKGACALLLAAVLVYPIMAIPARVTERFPQGQPPIGTLDGTAYMATALYQWPDAEHTIDLHYDREAIQWLWENVRGTPVLAEAAIGFYREGGLRVSSYTGLPTLIGAHEREQRPWEEVGPREEDAALLFNTTDTAQFWQIATRYRVQYIYVGQLERAVYEGPGLLKFEQLAQAGKLERVYHNERVDIYRLSAPAV